MAIAKNLYTRGLKQRLGGAVWYQRQGETIVRELAASVTNPRTEAQQNQRVQMANMVHMYQANRFWMDKYSFERKKTTWSDYNAFVSANAGVVPFYLTKEQSAAGACIVGDYKISDGSLPSITTRWNQGEPGWYTDIYLDSSLDIDENTTIAELSQSILDNNNGIREGDQISIIHNIQEVGDVPRCIARAYELIINSSDTRTLSSMGLYPGITRFQNTSLSPARFCLAYESAFFMSAVAFILSRTESGKTKVSTQNLEPSSQLIAYTNDFTGTTAQARARASYGAQEGAFLDARYYYSGASNEAVPMPLGIISVEGVAASGSLIVTQTGEQTLSILCNQEVDENLIGSIQLAGHQWNGTAWSTLGLSEEDIAVQGSTINVTFAFGNAYNVVESITIGYGSDEVTIEFAPYNPDVHP